MKQAASAAALFISVFLLFMLFWMGAFVLANHLGFDSQATPQYGFTSGIGPMLLTALGMSTIITGMWHHVNCHEPGCPRVGRHKINGTPWCNIHHGKARDEETTEDLLRQIVTLLERLQ